MILWRYCTGANEAISTGSGWATWSPIHWSDLCPCAMCKKQADIKMTKCKATPRQIKPQKAFGWIISSVVTLLKQTFPQYLDESHMLIEVKEMTANVSSHHLWKLIFMDTITWNVMIKKKKSVYSCEVVKSILKEQSGDRGDITYNSYLAVATGCAGGGVPPTVPLTDGTLWILLGAELGLWTGLHRC